MRRSVLKFLATFAVAGLVFTSCGDDDDGAESPAEVPEAPGGTEDGAEPSGGAPAAPDVDPSDSSARPDPEASGGGTITVDGITFTFTADEFCLINPDDPTDHLFIGSGSDPDGAPVHVYAGSGQLVVSLGTDDGTADVDAYELNPFEEDPISGMSGLESDGTTVRATPEMALRDTESNYDPVGTAEFEASC